MENQENEASHAYLHDQWVDTSTRLPTWIALLVLSMVSFFSMILAHHEWNGAWGWAITVAALSMVSGILGYLCYLNARAIFMGQLPELALGAFTFLLWCTGLPVIMNPSNNIAVGIDIIVDANVYFSSWGAFVCSLLLCGGLAREIYGFDIAGRATPIAKTRLGKWYVLVAASFVVMVASVRVFIAEECTKSDTVEPKCRKTKFAISAGVIGTIVSGIITLITLKFGKMKLAYEWEGALVMVVIWAVGSSQITAGDGPGQSVGNLYFATWASFILSLFIFADCHIESLVNRERPENSGMGANNDQPHESNIQVPDMEDVDDV